MRDGLITLATLVCFLLIPAMLGVAMGHREKSIFGFGEALVLTFVTFWTSTTGMAAALVFAITVVLWLFSESFIPRALSLFGSGLLIGYHASLVASQTK